MDAEGMSCAGGPHGALYWWGTQNKGTERRVRNDSILSRQASSSLKINLLTRTLNQMRTKTHRQGIQHSSNTRTPIFFFLCEAEPGIAVAFSRAGGVQAAFIQGGGIYLLLFQAAMLVLLFKFFFWGVRPQLYPREAHAEEWGWHYSLGI